MTLRIPDTPGQDTNPIQDNYDDQKGNYVSELDQIKKLEAVRTKHAQAIADRNRSASGGVEDVQGQEENPGNLWKNNLTPQKNKSGNQSTLKRLSGIGKSKKKVAISGVLLGGGLGSIVITIMVLLPLKLFGLVSNMTDAASKIPASIVEQQTERRTTQMLATWLIKKGAGTNVTDADTSMVFCKGMSIGCSFTATRINEYFDSRYDLSNISGIDGGTNTGKVTVTPKGRDRFGANARSWTINLETDLGELSRQVDHITSNKEMKAFIRNHVNERMATKSVITRYIARKVLMKRWGVTNWRAFEKTSNAIADKKSSFKAALIKNTVGKVSPQASTLLGCISGGQTCDKLREQISNMIDDTPGNKILDDSGRIETDAERDARLKKNEAYRKALGEKINIPGDEKIMTKYISKQLIGKLVGGAGILGVVDMVMNAVDTIDNGALESVIYTVRSTAYVGYAFGDESGIITNIEKIKAGDGDSDMLQIIAEQLENVEESPVFQAETGLLSSHDFSEGGFKRTCSGENNEPVDIVLTDSYVCPERQVVQDVTQFMNNPAGSTLRTLSNIWGNSVGLVFDFLGDVTGKALDFFKINDAISAIFGGSMQALAEWLIGFFFDVPSLGDEARGDQNYDALSAGVWISQNEMMENGVSNGDLLGAGGRVLSDEEVIAIQNDYDKQEMENFNSKSLLARMFDTDSPKSFTSQFLARIPVSTFTNTASIISLPSVAVASLSNSLIPSTQAQAGPLNPHNLPLYGYTSADLAMFDDPGMFNEEYCKQSAIDREDSYGEIDGYKINGYSKVDPCALERIVAGNILHDMGVTDDKHSFRDPVGTGSSNGGGARMSESELLAKIKEYGLPDPEAQTVGAVWGWEQLLETLETNDKAKWAAESLLAGEKRWIDAGGVLKEYLNTAWMWVEYGQSGWPDPYSINCYETDQERVSQQCQRIIWQLGGYQAGDRAYENKFTEVFNKLYSENELIPIMKDVLSNSDKAMMDRWSYKDRDQQTMDLLAEFINPNDLLSSVDGATISDIATTRDGVDGILQNRRKQFFTALLGKDPAMVAALNSYAVTDSDIVPMLLDCNAHPWSAGSPFYCSDELRPRISNMMYALWKFDSMYGGPSGGSGGTGVESIWGGGSMPLGQEWGVTDFSRTGYYDNYAGDLGVPNAHPGLDYNTPDKTKLYTPVSGKVVAAGGTCYFRDDRYTKYDNSCGNSTNLRSNPGTGEFRIEFTVDGKTHQLILGHMSKIEVSVGDTLSAGDYIGLSGDSNVPHVHVEYRIPGNTSSSQQAVDPREYLK